MPSRGRQFLQRLGEQVLIGDGAMGSRLYELGASFETGCEYLNLTQPDTIRRIHREYLDAGAHLIQTNTFSANRIKLDAHGLADQFDPINRAAVALARQVAGDRAYVAGSIGPLPALAVGRTAETLTEDQIKEAFREQITLLVEAGVDLIQLETFTDFDQVRLALAEAKSICDLPVIAQMTLPDGRHTPEGLDGFDALQTLHDQGADVIGTNCGHGVARVLRAVEYLGRRTDALLSAYPNAGMPEQVDGRFIYLATPRYLADSAEQMVRAGANLVGGCCGTKTADIAAIARRLAKLKPARRARLASVRVRPVRPTTESDQPPRPLPDFLRPADGRTIILVELDPPKTTDLQKTLHGVRAIRDAGASAVTLGDSPLAQLRMNSMIAGALVQRETDLPVLCHLACRDRNLIGTQSLLLGAHALGIRNILALTGDPAKVGNHPDATSVYDLNSFKLIELIMQLNRGRNGAGLSIGRPTAFHVGVAFNPNKRDLGPEVRRLKRKVERGATFALTQAVFDPDTMRRACEAAGELNIPLFAGVFVLLTDRHAEFLHNEFPGITVCDAVRRRMADAAPDKRRMADEGMAIARELIDAFGECADGLYLIPPLNRVPVAVELVRYIRSRDRAATP